MSNLTDFIGGSGGQRQIMFTTSGTYVSPIDQTVQVICVGGGGGNDTSYSAGGGSGYVTVTDVVLTKGQTVTVTVGIGGSANADGGISSFGTYASANGGGHTTTGYAENALGQIVGSINSSGDTNNSTPGGIGFMGIFGHGAMGSSYNSVGGNKYGGSDGSSGVVIVYEG